MPILTELLVSIVGGVATALILGVLVRPSAPVDREMRAPRRRTVFGDFVHLLLSVAGGIALALLAGRWAMQSGLAPRGGGGRLILLVGGTALCWFLMLPLRRR